MRSKDFEIKATATVLAHPREMIWLTDDLRNTTYRAKGDWVNLVGAKFEAVDFRGSVFDPFNAQASTFVGCDFSRVKMKSGSLGILKGKVPSIYRDCRFEKADLRGAFPSNSRFERCLFRNTRLDGWTGLEAAFVECTFEGRLTGIRFAGSTAFPPYGSMFVDRSRNEFRGNDFSAAELHQVEFILGIDLDANRLPVGPVYVLLDRLPERVARARAAVAKWPDDTNRETALYWLRNWSENGYANQEFLFKRRSDVVTSAPTVMAPLLELLEGPLD